MGYIESFVEFLFDEKKKLSRKATVVLISILAVLLVDNILGFTFYYNNEKKIEQIQKLNEIINDSKTDSITRAFSIKTRSEIICRESILSQFTSIQWKIKRANSETSKNNNNLKVDETVDFVEKNAFWFNIAAGGIYYLLSVIAIPIMIFADKRTSLIQRISTALIVSFLLFICGWFIYWACNFIPKLSDNSWGWNYGANICIQLITLGLLALIGREKGDK